MNKWMNETLGIAKISTTVIRLQLHCRVFFIVLSLQRWIIFLPSSSQSKWAKLLPLVFPRFTGLLLKVKFLPLATWASCILLWPKRSASTRAEIHNLAGSGWWSTLVPSRHLMLCWITCQGRCPYLLGWGTSAPLGEDTASHAWRS